MGAELNIRCEIEDVASNMGSPCVRVISTLRIGDEVRGSRIDYVYNPNRVNLCVERQRAALMDEALDPSTASVSTFDACDNAGTLAPAPLSPRIVQALIAVAAFTALTAIALSLGWL